MAGRIWDWWTTDSLEKIVSGGKAGKNGTPGEGSESNYMHGGGGGGGGRGGYAGAAYGTGGGDSIMTSGQTKTRGEDGYANGQGGASLNNNYKRIGGRPGNAYNWGEAVTVLKGLLGSNDLRYTITTKISGVQVGSELVQMERGKLKEDDYVSMLDLSKATGLGLLSGRVFEGEFKARDNKNNLQAAAKAGFGGQAGSWYGDTYWVDSAESGLAWKHPGDVTFELPECDVKRVTYSDDAVIADSSYVEQYTSNPNAALQVNADGSVSAYTQLRNLPVNVTHKTNPDKAFAGWTCEYNGNTYTALTDDLMNTGDDIVFEAVWEPKYTLTLNSPENGTVTAEANGQPVMTGARLGKGTVVTVTFKPNEDYQLMHGSGSGDSRKGSYYQVELEEGTRQVSITSAAVPLLMNGDLTVNAFFEPCPIDNAQIAIQETISPFTAYETYTPETDPNGAALYFTEAVRIQMSPAAGINGSSPVTRYSRINADAPGSAAEAEEAERGVARIEPADNRMHIHAVITESTGSSASITTPVIVIDDELPEFWMGSQKVTDGEIIITDPAGATLEIRDNIELATVTVKKDDGAPVIQQIAGDGKSVMLTFSENGVYTVTAQDKASANAQNLDDAEKAARKVTLTVNVKICKLRSISDAAPLSFDNGTAADVIKSSLPETVGISTSDGSKTANVRWDSITGYDPGKTKQQDFTVTGIVALPDGVVNPDNVPLTTSAQITVRAANALVSIGSVQDQTYANGTEKSAIIADLPAQVRITTTDGGQMRDVTWNKDALNGYNQAELNQQKFTLTGTVDVSGLSNPQGVANTVSMAVTVEAKKAPSPVLVDLVSIIPPRPITDVPNGTPLVDDILALLPHSVGIETTQGQSTADVSWYTMIDIAYDPTKTSAQSFIIRGAAVLPEGVENNRNVPLEVRITVIVRGRNETTDDITFVNVGALASITAPYGTNAADLPLPPQVQIETTAGWMMADVDWSDEIGPVYNRITLEGTVTLPAGVKPKDANPILAKIVVNVIDAEGFISVVTPEDVYGVLNGTSKEDVAEYYLPDSVLIRVQGNKTFRAGVVWDLSGYDPDNKERQTVAVTGAVQPVAGVSGMENVTTSLTMYVMEELSELISVEEPGMVTVPNGTPLESIPLPGTLAVTTDKGTAQIEVFWDLDSARGDYDPSLATEQRFTVTGWVVLPPTAEYPYEWEYEVHMLVVVMQNPALEGGAPGSLPKTGDPSSLLLWSAMLALCGAGLTALRRRHALK